MTVETFEKAQKLYKRIENAGYLIDNAKDCNWIGKGCDGKEFDISESMVEVIVEVLTREKEKWEKELEAL